MSKERIVSERIYLENTEGKSFKYYCLDIFKKKLEKRYFLCATYGRIIPRYLTKYRLTADIYNLNNLKKHSSIKEIIFTTRDRIIEQKKKKKYIIVPEFKSFGYKPLLPEESTSMSSISCGYDLLFDELEEI